METIVIKNIIAYDSALELIEEERPEVFASITEEIRGVIKGMDDYEFFQYIVINGSEVLITSLPSGDVFSCEKDIDKFIRETIECAKTTLAEAGE